MRRHQRNLSHSGGGEEASMEHEEASMTLRREHEEASMEHEEASMTLRRPRGIHDSTAP